MIDVSGEVVVLQGAAASVKTPVSARYRQEFGVKVGEYLFKEGQAHIVYRVKKGAIAVLERNVGRPNGVVEIAGPSDFVGLGVLEKYCESARAVQDSIVSSLSHDEFINLSERNPTLKKKQAEAIDRELEHTKTLLSRSHRSTPAECLASFLVAVSYLNFHEGRDPAVIPDSLKCGTVASLMNIDVDTLARALVELKRRGLIEECSQGHLHLKSVGELEHFSEGIAESAKL